MLDEIFFFKPQFFFVSLALGLIIITLGVYVLIKNRSERFWLGFILPPALFFLSFSFYSAVIVSQFWIQAIFLLIVWFTFAYLKNIYYYFSFGAPERADKLRRLLLSGAFLSAFALAAILFALPIFLNLPLAILIGLFAVISLPLFGQFLLFSKDIEPEQKIFWLVNVLILTEVVSVFSLLPLSYNILGLMTAIIFYLLILFEDWRLTNRLNYRHLRWPLIIGSVIFIFILLSARWL